MKQFRTSLAIVLVAAAALAGCANNEDADPTPATPSPTPSTPATTTPTATSPTLPVSPTVPVSPSVPTVTPPVTPPTLPTTPVTGTNNTSVRVFVVSAPEHAANGTQPQICWRIEAQSGTSVHTAIHYGPTSKPNGTFTDYPKAVYPNNGPATTTGSFAIPGTFCGAIDAVDANVYIRPHALINGQSILGPEEALIAGSGNSTADLIGAPEVFPAGQAYNFCWEVPGVTGTSVHTAIHYDNVSHPNGTFSDYKEAAYPNNGPATTSGSFAMPGPFCANITMPASGVLYMRAHALVNGTSYLGPERSVVVGSRVTVSNGVPATAAAASTVMVCWRAESSGTSGHTAFHWDTTSHPSATAVSDYPNAIYPNNGPATTSGSFALPGPFCGNLTMPASGAVYFRPHVVYPAPGGQELGAEYVIRVA